MRDRKLKQTVNFDRNDIRRKLTRYRFSEARRLRGPIYEAIVKELYEEGCPTAGKHFECLANKEADLIESNSIRVPVSNDTVLLSALVNNIKCAEKSYKIKSCGGFVATFRLLDQCLQLLEQHSVTYNWLLRDVFVIICNICKSVKDPSDSTAEVIARIYYKHGVYLSSKASDLPRAIKYLEKALSLTRCNMWFINENNQKNIDDRIETIHEAGARQLCKVLLKYATEVGHNSPATAAELAQKAVLTIAELGIEANRVYYYGATIKRASYLIANEDSASAITLLEGIYNYLCSHCESELKKLHCKCAMYMAMCYSSLHSDQMALEKFKESVYLSRKFDWQILEADTLVKMGKHLSKDVSKCKLAKEAFETARKIYSKHGDMNAVGQTSYLLCKLQAHEMMPYLMMLLKTSGEQFCDFSNLRLWKTQVKPFWPTMQEDEEIQEHDEIYCLLAARSEEYEVGIKNIPQATQRERRRSSKAHTS